MGDIIGVTGSLASFIGSLTVVGGALIWVYNKFIGKPREIRREKEDTKRQLRMVETITRENKPLNDAIKQLNEWLQESKKDREKLNKVADVNTSIIKEHEKKLHNHDDRLIILEVKNNIPVKRS